jgi:hypothetical protein
MFYGESDETLPDLELDLEARWGSKRSKNKSSQNLFKTDMCVGIDVKNPMQL